MQSSSWNWKAKCEHLTKTVLGNPFIPHKPYPKQAQFLVVDHIKEGFYGGAAGGGKSDAMLMAALQYVDQPNYNALILRRTFPDLSKPGAIMDRACDWLNGIAKWNNTLRKFRFPSGATLSFGYCKADRDKYQYQGAEFQFVGFDELTQFTEEQYTYLFSRLRAPKEGFAGPLRMRAASNPGGVGHSWVKKRFIDNLSPKAFFVPATLRDNPSIPDDYREMLAKLDPTTRKRLEDGDWNVVDREGCEWPADFFDDAWIWFDEYPKHHGLKVITLDPSKGRDSKTSDYSAYVSLVQGLDGTIYVDADLARRDCRKIVSDGINHAKLFVPHAFAVETNGFQELLRDDFEQLSREYRIDLPLWCINNHINKITRIRTLTPVLAQRRLRFKRGSTGAALLVDQMRDFPIGDHDDGPDALEMAVRMLALLDQGNPVDSGIVPHEID